jgi:hypothetical protein
MKILESYKKIANSMLIEHAWDRKFGEPLPTLEDVMREAEVDPDKVIGKNDDGDDVTVKQALDSSGKNPTMAKLKKQAQALKAKGDDDAPAGDDDAPADKGAGLGKGDFERPGTSEPEDKPFGGDTGADADSETGKDYVSKFQGTDEPEGEPSGEPEGGEEGEVDREEVTKHHNELQWKSDNEQGTVNPAIKSMLQSDDPNENEGAREYIRSKWSDFDRMRDLEGYFEDVGADEEFFAKEQEAVDANNARMKEFEAKGDDITPEEEDEWNRIEDQNKRSETLLDAGERVGLHKRAEGGKEESIKVINGKKYRAIKESVEPKKHLLREMYERIGGK